MNHYAFGCVDDWIFRTINGIDKLEPGFKKILIQPKPDASLFSVSRKHHTPYGVVSSAWKKENGAFDLEVDISCNTTSLIMLPDGEIHEIGSGEYMFNGSLPEQSVI